MDQAQIAALIETAPYEASTTAKLEAYVAQQLSSRTYDFAANKALLKNYQVNNSAAKLDVVCNVLALSLMRLPSTDFVTLNYLVPVQFVNHASVQAIQALAGLLERGQFLAFWQKFIAEATLFASATGFVDLVRMFILGNLRDTYTAIPKKIFAQQVGLDEANIEAFCAGNNFIEKIAVDNIVFTRNEENHAKLQAHDDALHTEEGLKIAARLLATK